MTHNLEATVFVYQLRETGQIKCEYLEQARILEDDPDWEHLATLEPRMWIEHNWGKVMNEEKPMTTEQQKALEALQDLHNENERLGLYKDAYAQSMTTQKRPQNCGTSYCSCIECVMEPDYKALWEQMCERCDELDKKLAQLEQKPIAKVCHDIEQHIGWNPNVNVAELPEGMELYGSSQPKESEKKPVTWIDDYNACKCPDNEARCFSDKVFRMMQKHITPPQRKPMTLVELSHIFASQDALGTFSDRLESVMAMEDVPLPPALKDKARREAINDIISEMREVYEQYTGENPWH